jgi:Domain of unknown function (DUF929)
MGRKTNKMRRATQAQSAREKAAAARQAQQRTNQRRRATVILSSVVTVAVIAAVIAVIVLNQPSHSSAIANNRGLAPASVVDDIRNVPTTTFDSVGLGSVDSAPEPVTGPLLRSGGKPELLFIGAEWCPLCATERWGMAVALSRFGTLHDLRLTQSASNDSYPNTHTIDFWHSSYSSKYLAFDPVENEDRNRKPLVEPTRAQTALWGKYGKVNGDVGYPFLDFGNKYVVLSPSYDPSVLKGLTQEQIASKLADPSDPVAKGVDGTANLLSAAICSITNNQPASVCDSQTITGIEGQLATLPQSGSSG